ncbi:MAG TPA: hypothetical protein VHL11_05725 [Phototrophicaceae bacterium]|jgi:hypothetical protein|nr:hypothetical protein [Phototrophicaceae bacterium]
MMNRKQLVALNPDFRILDRFSLSILRKISVIYPEWIKYATITEFNRTKYLTIHVPAPVDPTDHDLVISVEVEYYWRITVHFDGHHAHFYMPQKAVGWQVRNGKRIPKMEYEADAEEQMFETAHLFIEDILHERRVVGIKMQNNRLYSGCNYSSDGLDQIKPGDVTYIRSWLGTYNKRYE